MQDIKLNYDKIFNKLIEQLKIDEGFTAKAFWDLKQFTNGYGTKALSPDEIITREEAEKRLKMYAESSLLDVIMNFNFITSEKLILAIANMRYNLGLNGLLGFRNMIRALQVKDYKKAAYEAYNSRWYSQVGGRKEIPINDILNNNLRRSERIVFEIHNVDNKCF